MNTIGTRKAFARKAHIVAEAVDRLVSERFAIIRDLAEEIGCRPESVISNIFEINQELRKRQTGLKAVRTQRAGYGEIEIKQR